MNTPYKCHDSNDDQWNEHLESVYSHLNHEKYEFWYINFGNNSLITFDDFNTLVKRFIKEIPQSDSNKDKDCKIWYFWLEYISEHEYIDHHEAKGIQYPPEPVQVGIGNFGFQLCLRRIYGLFPVFLHVISESFKHKIRSCFYKKLQPSCN